MSEFDLIFEKYNKLSKAEEELYINLSQQANEQCKELLNDNLGPEFVKNCGRDIAGEVVRQFLDTSDFYITVDQLYNRIVHFTYENDYNPLKNNNITKNVYNYSDNPVTQKELKNLIKNNDNNQQKLFEKELNEKNGIKQYKDKNLMQNGKRHYVENIKNEDGSVTDEYTGKEGEYIIDKNGDKRRRQEVDHIQAAATVTYNKEYIKEEGIRKLKIFMNTKDNFAMMDKVANASKGDVRVFDKNGNDITYRASAEQIKDAVCDRWENVKSDKTKQELIDKGYLNEDGKVPKSVQKTLVDNINHSQSKESVVILKNADYKKVSKNAGKSVAQASYKILIGQLLYYAVPPIMYEVRLVISEKDITLENALTKFEESSKRVFDYIKNNLKDLISNTLNNGLKKFVKSFLDILINLVKSTVKKMLTMAKSLVLATIDSIHIIADKNTTPAQKTDAIFSLFSVTVTNIVLECLFEFIEAQFGIPEIFLTPLQMIASVVCSNLVILVLKKLDLFNVKFGFQIQKIREIYDNTRNEFITSCNNMLEENEKQIDQIMKIVDNKILDMSQHFATLNYYEQSVRPQLQEISNLFNMNIDFETEWNKYIES